MENTKLFIKQIHQMLLVLVVFCFLFPLLNGQFKISLLNVLGDLKYSFFVFQVIWLLLLGIYILLLFRAVKVRWIKFGLIPLSIISFLFFVGLLFLGKNISSQEGIWFYFIFWLLVFPIHGYSIWVDNLQKRNTILFLIMLVSVIIAGIVNFVVFYDFWFIASFWSGLLNFLIGTIVFSILFFNAILLISLPTLYLTNKFVKA
jgi:hypothetical protein